MTPSDLWTPRPGRCDGASCCRPAPALALGACASRAAGSGAASGGTSTGVIEPKVDGDLYYFNYSQYIDPALVKEFEKRYDVRVIESYFDSMEGMLAKLRAGNAYDVMFPTAEYVQRLIQQEQLLRIPRDKLENLDNIYGYFDDPWYDPDSAHSVPYALYITGIGYRADILDNMTGSWDDLGNEEAAGRIYVLDDYQEALAAGNLRNGYDMNTVVESELDATKDWLVDLKPLLRGFSVDTITNMSSGNAWIQHLWNGDIVNIRYRVDDPDAYQFQKIDAGRVSGRQRRVRDPGQLRAPGHGALVHRLHARPQERRARTSAGTATRCPTTARTRRSRSWPRATRTSSSPSTTSRAVSSSPTSPRRTASCGPTPSSRSRQLPDGF